MKSCNTENAEANASKKFEKLTTELDELDEYTEKSRL